jgi:hypothetical protein
LRRITAAGKCAQLFLPDNQTAETIKDHRTAPLLAGDFIEALTTDYLSERSEVVKRQPASGQNKKKIRVDRDVFNEAGKFAVTGYISR